MRSYLFFLLLIVSGESGRGQKPLTKQEYDEIPVKGSLFSALTDHFRSKVSGSWNSPDTWESSPDHFTWINATLSPTSDAGTISILNGHEVTITADVMIDQVTIESGGSLNHTSESLTIANGTGDDLTVAGGGVLTLSNSAFTFEQDATASIEPDGILKVNVAGITNNGSGVNAASFIYKHGAILEYALNTDFPASGVTFFPNVAADVVPVFRITALSGTSPGGEGPTVVNGMIEANSSFAWTGTGQKTFRNGITGTGTMSQGNSGQWLISGTAAILAGSGSLNLGVNGLEISSETTLALSSDKTISTGNMTVKGTVQFGTHSLTGTGSVSFNAGSSCETAHVDGLNGSVVLSGNNNFADNVNFTFNGTSVQATGSTFPGKAGSLIIDNAAGVVISNTSLTVNSVLQINEGKKLEIGEGKLVTAPTIVNNGGTGGLVIRSTAAGQGSLINFTEGVEATVERYIPATDWEDGKDGWHFLSCPVVTGHISGQWTPTGTNNDYDFYAWDESSATGNWKNQKEGTFDFETFQEGRGYLVAYQVAETKIFADQLHSQSVQIEGLSHTTGQNYAGWHLLGNPFPCAISWNQGNWNRSDEIGLIPQIWSSTDKSYKVLRGDGVIPAMSGFMVYSKNSGGSLTIPADAQLLSDSNWYKSACDELILCAIDPDHGAAQETVIRFDAHANAGFDPGEDCLFMAGFAPVFATRAGDQRLALNTLSCISQETVIPLDFVKTSSSHFLIKLQQSIDGMQVLLTDRLLAQTVNLSHQQSYSFTSTHNDEPGRFLLHFQGAGNGKTDVPRPVSIFMKENELCFVNANGAPVSGAVMIFNMAGQKVMEFRIEEESHALSRLQIPPGYYCVKMIAGQGVFTSKVFVRPY